MSEGFVSFEKGVVHQVVSKKGEISIKAESPPRTGSLDRGAKRGRIELEEEEPSDNILVEAITKMKDHLETWPE